MYKTPTFLYYYTLELKIMEYINRTKDFEQIISSINNYDITMILAGKAFGLSSFLCELGRRMFQYRVFLLNTINGSNIAHLLISDIIHSEDRSTFKKMVEKEFGEKSISLLAAILQGIPYAGPGLAQLIEGKELPAIYAGNYTSAVEEILLPYIKKYVSLQKVLIVIDEAQNMTEDSYNLIANLAQIDEVKIVLGITNTMRPNYIKLKNRLSLYSNISFHVEYFGQPEEKLINELANHLGITLSDSMLKNILYQTHKNIHLIIESILSISMSKNSMMDFNEIDKAIISLLFICYFGLSKSTLKSLINVSNVYSPNIDEELNSTLSNLEKHSCILKKYINETQIYFIASLYHPEIERCTNNYSDMLYYKSIVYDYYQRQGMKSSKEILELLYKLSIEFSNHSIKKYAIALLEYKLKNGEQISEDIIANAHLSKKNNKEVELSVLYYTRERRYSEALKWIEFLKSKRSNYRYNILKSILLNRIRNFSEAESMLLYNINTIDEPKILNTLLAYYVANCIHTNKKETAIKEYNNRIHQLDGTENWGYFLRNLASAVPFSEKKGFYQDAIDNFSFFKDDYGIFSSKCNLGNSLCVVKKASEALLYLREAEIGLQQFGPNHLHIVYNDLGVCYLMLGDIKNSTKYLSLAEKLAYNRMPRLITAINKACLLSVQHEYNLSLNKLDLIKDEVLVHPVASIGQKYFTNRLLIEYQKGINTFIDYQKNNKSHIDNFVNEVTMEKYKILLSEKRQIEYPSKEWNDLFFPGGLAYWYVDPLKMI